MQTESVEMDMTNPTQIQQSNQTLQPEIKKVGITTSNNAHRTTWSLTDFKQECIQEMANNGVPLPFSSNLITDGTIRRYSRDSKQSQPDEWYSAHEVPFKRNDGHEQWQLIVSYGSWSDNKKYTYYSWKNDSSYSQEDCRKLNQIRAEKLEQTEIERSKKCDEEATQALQIWQCASESAPDSRYMAYIEKKGIKPIGIRFCDNPSRYPALIIPFKNIAGEIRAIEYISLDEEKGVKYASCFGGRTGNFNIIDGSEIKNGDHITVAEGWATGVSIFMANQGIVCNVGGSNNIDNVVANLRKAYPNSPITLAVDLDKNGREIAYSVAKKHENIKLVEPVFPKDKSSDSEKNKIYTDFNDLHKVCGIDEVRRQLLNTITVKTTADELRERAKEILKISDPCESFSLDFLPRALKDYVENVCQTTNAHPLMVTCSALAAFAVSLNTNVKIPYGEYYQDLYPNIWFLILGKSGFFKSTALRRGGAYAYEKNSQIIKKVKEEERKLRTNISKEEKEEIEENIRNLKLEDPIIPSSITPEAFIQYLATGHIGAFFHNEFGGFIKSDKDGNLMQILTDLYDMPETYRKLTKNNGEDNLERPFFIINGLSTLDWIKESLIKKENRDVKGGFFTRFLIFTPPIKKDVIPKGLPDKDKTLDPKSIRIKQEYESKIRSIEESVKAQPRDFFLSPEAVAVFSDPVNNSGIHEIIYGMKKNYNEPTQELFESFLKRWSPTILKLAMMMELLNNPDSTEITKTSIYQAFNMVLPAIKSTGMLFQDALGESIIQRNCRCIIEYIANRSGSVTRGQLIKSGVLPNAKTKDYDEILTLLTEGGNLDVKRESNKTAWVYSLTKENSGN